MTIEMAGPIGVQARIAAIQGRFAQSAVSTVTSGATSGTRSATSGARSVSSGTGSTDFAEVLAKLTSGATDGGAVSGAVSGDQVVAGARRYLGVPYVWGGTDPAKGLDCSGLVQRVYKDLGIEVPRVSQDQARAGTAVPGLAQAKPGDLLIFGATADHIGIYIGNNKMVAAPKAGDVVKVQDVYRTPSSIRRILPDSAAAASPFPSLAAASSASAAPSTSSPSTSPAMAAAPAEYRLLFEQAGRRYGVSPDLLAAVAKTESGFNPRAVSSAGARGLMQIMPATARGLGVDPTNPAQAVDGAARLLSQHQRSFGSTSLALAAYNAGPGAVQKYNGVPPYAETRSYVTKVLAAAGRST